MLYLLVVRVFGTAAEKWYYLLALGWGRFTYLLSGFVHVSAQGSHRPEAEGPYLLVLDGVKKITASRVYMCI